MHVYIYTYIHIHILCVCIYMYIYMYIYIYIHTRGVGLAHLPMGRVERGRENVRKVMVRCGDGEAEARRAP